MRCGATGFWITCAEATAPSVTSLRPCRFARVRSSSYGFSPRAIADRQAGRSPRFLRRFSLIISAMASTKGGTNFVEEKKATASRCGVTFSRSSKVDRKPSTLEELADFKNGRGATTLVNWPVTSMTGSNVCRPTAPRCFMPQAMSDRCCSALFPQNTKMSFCRNPTSRHGRKSCSGARLARFIRGRSCCPKPLGSLQVGLMHCSIRLIRPNQSESSLSPAIRQPQHGRTSSSTPCRELLPSQRLQDTARFRSPENVTELGRTQSSASCSRAVGTVARMVTVVVHVMPSRR